MATEREAAATKSQAFDILGEQIHVRPGAVGVVHLGAAGWGLKVTLPFKPAGALPSTVMGVPVEYDVFHEEPALLAAAPRWRRRG